MAQTVLQTPADLAAQYRDQLSFIRASAAAFDNGRTEEAKRLALALRVLLHQTSQSHALVRQLQLPLPLFFASRPALDPENLLGTSSLVFFQGVEPTPRLDLVRVPFERTQFDTWWRKEIVVRVGRDVFTREELVVKRVANQDGGAHVGPLDAKYVRLAKSEGLGWTHAGPDEAATNAVLGFERACVRQIAHEALKTFEEAFLVEETQQGLVVLPSNAT